MMRLVTTTPPPIQLNPATIITEDELWTVAVNSNQNLLGKSMLVLRRPCSSVAQLADSEWMGAHVWIGRVCAAVDALFRPDLYNHCFLMNMDRQVHLHVIPRYASERHWEGQLFRDTHWGTLFGREEDHLPDDRLLRLASQIRAELPGRAAGAAGRRA